MLTGEPNTYSLFCLAVLCNGTSGPTTSIHDNCDTWTIPCGLQGKDSAVRVVHRNPSTASLGDRSCVSHGLLCFNVCVSECCSMCIIQYEMKNTQKPASLFPNDNEVVLVR